jgi:ribosomal protein S18 acetylase RimI-like enzyme
MQYIWQLQPAAIDFKPLYQKNGWINYLRDWQKTERAIQQSQTLTAVLDNQAVGFIRAITDAETILYVQDLLVLPAYQRQGIGSALVAQLLAKYSEVSQVVLISEPTAAALNFYHHAGLKAIPADYGTSLVLNRR